MKSDVLDMMRDINGALGVQTLFLAPPYEDIKKMDFEIGQKLYVDFQYESIWRELEENCLEDTVYVMRNSLYMYHTIFRFPEPIVEEYGYRFCIMGPVLFQPLGQEEFQEIMRQHKIDSQYAYSLQVFYSRIPVLETYEFWNNIVLHFCRLIFQKEIRMVQSHEPGNAFLRVNVSELSAQPDPQLAVDTIEKRYEAENAMLQAVRQGNVSEAVLRHNQFRQYRILPRSSDSVRNMKNLSFVMNTLLRKAVEEVHVHPMYIDDLSCRMAIRIENCTSESQLQKLSNEMVRKYCLLVQNHSRMGYSSLVHDCLDYVDFHYSEPLSLKDLAERFSVSSTYLSPLFKKEAHMNLIEYIQSVRLRQALVLLNTTRLPIQEIAGQCGFLDVNYFTRVFKKSYEVSPREYRNKIRGT